MKKIILLILTIALILCTSCSNSNKDDPIQSASPTVASTPENDSESNAGSEDKTSEDDFDDSDASDEPKFEPTITTDEVHEHGVSPEADFVIETNKDGTGILTGYTGKDKVLVIPGSINGIKVTSIGAGAFKDTDILAVMIGDDVETIEKEAFAKCKKLEIFMCSSESELKRVEEAAFYNCPALYIMMFDDEIEYIGANALRGCSSITYLPLPPSIEEMDVTSLPEPNDNLFLYSFRNSYADTFGKNVGYNMIYLD